MEKGLPDFFKPTPNGEKWGAHLMTDSPAVSLKPEEKVRQATLKELVRLGWKESQLRWKPEWQIPKTPHDLTKRERGQKYATCGSADLVAFADESAEAQRVDTELQQARG